MYKNIKIGLASAAIVAGLLVSSAVLADEKKGDQGLGDKPAQPQMMVNINPSGHAALRGTIDSVGANSLAVKSWGGLWTVNIASSTKSVRKFGGAANLSEFQKGDWVEAQGKINESAVWTIDATMVRNNSIQTRNAEFSGTISNLSGSSFSLATEKRGTVKVTVNADAKIMVNGKAGAVSDLQNGMKAGVKGVWDRTQTSVAASMVSARTPAPPKPEKGNHGNGNGENQNQ